jgi:DMSO/TMAO reductase YedYZ molybdopterin-dependent catalytic subunit
MRARARVGASRMVAKLAGTEAGLVVVRAEPLNCETPISALMGGTVMSNEHFYVRNHFPVPALDGARWRLHVGGLVRRPLRLGLRDLVNLPARVQTVTLECAGNGRSFLTPAVAGEQWVLGAVSTAEWTGVPLAEILDRAGVKPAAKEVVFKAADGTPDKPSSGASRFVRSLTLDEVRQSEVLLAYAMNGRPLPSHHGYPLRVIVPGWYGVASVKWLTEIELVGDSFSGYFQTQKYVYEWERDGRIEREAVRQMRVRALITQPGADEVVDIGTLAVRGLAWSGVAPIARVEISINGEAWQPAQLFGQGSTHSWQRWELLTQVDRPGRIALRARATDQAGRTQPEQQEWNRLGYGNNAVQAVSIRAKRPRAGLDKSRRAGPTL